jgi:hypothetical protein
LFLKNLYAQSCVVVVPFTLAGGGDDDGGCGGVGGYGATIGITMNKTTIAVIVTAAIMMSA